LHFEAVFIGFPDFLKFFDGFGNGLLLAFGGSLYHIKWEFNADKSPFNTF
jgi:hypothetical protein